ncbi:MAG: TIGR03936 family radical SAM-associated protein [Eubacteriaceae bacterium]
MIIRAIYTKTGELKYLSHLDMVRLIERAFRRSGLELNYTQGFHPTAKISFSPPVALGIESYCEMMEADVSCEDFSEGNFKEKLNAVLPLGCSIISAAEIKDTENRMSKCIVYSEYEIIFDCLDCDDLVISIYKATDSDSCFVKKTNKSGKEVLTDIKNKIIYLDAYENSEGKAVLRCILDNTQNSILSPAVLMDYLKESCYLKCPNNYRIIKKDVIIK